MASNWQPIESAPKDGRPLLLCRMHDGKLVAMGEGFWGRRYNQFNHVPTNEGERWCRGCGLFAFPEPTHWRRLPRAPNASLKTPLDQEQ